MDEEKKKEEQAQPELDEFDEWERMTPEERIEKARKAPPCTPGNDPILDYEIAKRKAIEENAPAMFDSLWASLREEDREEIRKVVHALPTDENEFALTFENEFIKFAFKFFLEKEQGRVRVENADRADHPAFLQMLQGTATNRFRATATKNIVIDRNGNATIEEEGFKAFFKGYAKLKGGLSVGAKKLLDMGSIKLANNNHYRAEKGLPIDTAVSIPLEEYGRMRGFDITPRQTSTPEDKEAEKKRLDGVIHNIRKSANAELALLYSLSLSWKEPRKKHAGYTDIRILQSKGIRGGYINMRFSEDIANYLTHAYIMPYPTALQTIDERNQRAYNIGWKLALHHSMYNNRMKGTANIISIACLLEACGDMPTFEEVQASRNRGHWERLIKDPLEAALDRNLESEVIASWEYCNSKREPLDDGQISIANYPTFARLYIHFEMAGTPDQSERLHRKAERMEKEKAKRPRKKATSKKNAEGGGE